MPNAFCGHPLIEKNVTKMGAAPGTNYFCAPTIGIGNLFYRARNSVIKTWPSGTGIEFIL